MSQLDTECLKLNKNWIPIGVISVRKAFLDAAAEAVTLLRFHDGYPTPLRMEDWLKIEADNEEDSVLLGTSLHGTRRIKVPRVAICTNFDRIILKEQKLTKERLAKRYDYTCAVSGKKLEPHEYSREHVRPRSRGGASGWRFEVLMDKRLNSARGNKSYRKLGLKKPKILPPPGPVPPFATIVNRYGYSEWDLFSIPHAASLPESSTRHP